LRFFIILGLLFLNNIYSQSSCNLFSNIQCIDENRGYYFYKKEIPLTDCGRYNLNDREKIFLKEQLTQSIVSIVETKSSQSIEFSESKKNFSEKEVFYSFSKSNSSAILFNPKFSLCRQILNGSEKLFVYVYVNKSEFNRLMLDYFRSSTNRLSKSLSLNEQTFISNKYYDFKEEVNELNNGLKTLSSFYGLMISLNIDKNSIEKFLLLENRIYSFFKKINSVENKLKLVNKNINENNFVKAYKLIESIDLTLSDKKLKNQFKSTIKYYNDRVKIERKNKIKNLKNQSVSFNNISLGLGMNSGISNINSNVDPETNNNHFDVIYPFIDGRILFNDRDHKFGYGGYFQHHLSTSLITLSNSDYISPFSSNFSEVGLLGQYFFIRDSFGDSMTSISFSIGNLLGSYFSEDLEKLNFWTFSPGIKTYLQSDNTRSYRTSLFFRSNFILGKNPYTYSSFSVGLSMDFKINRKISSEDKIQLENEFKTY
jgi:hypothetical protein